MIGFSAARRASSSAETSSVSSRPFTDSRMRSPLRTCASGPPIADSGVTCSTIVPAAVPLIRPSEMRTMSFTPARASFFGIGR